MNVDLLAEIWGVIPSISTEGAQVLLSAALVLATGAYTYFTLKQTTEMSESREVSNQPVVQGGVDSMFPGSYAVVLTNTGNGAAHNVSAEVYFEDVDVEPLDFRTSIMQPGEEYEFGFPLNDEDGFVIGDDEVKSLIEDRCSDGILTVKTECESPFGDQYEYENEIDVLDVIGNLSQIIRDSEVEKIRKAVEGIDSNLEDISDGIGEGYRDTKAYSELTHLIADTIEQEDVIGFDDLRYRLGINEKKIAYNVINRLQKGGLVDYSSDKNLMLHDNVEIEWLGGSVEDVDEEGIGGASGGQLIGEIRSRRTSSEQGIDEDSESESDEMELEKE